MIDKKNQSVFLNPLVISASIVILVFGLKAGSSLISPILFALLLTILIIPAIKWLERKGLPKWLALTVICLITVGIICLLIGIFFVSINKLAARMPYYQEQLAAQLAPITEWLTNQGIDMNNLIPEDWLTGTSVIKGAVALLSAIISSSFNLFFFILTLILMLVAADSFVDKFKKKHSNDTASNDVAAWVKDTQQQFNIQTSNNLFTAILVTIAYYFLRIDFPVLWGLITFLFAYIPNIGIVLASIPPIILAFIQYGWATAVITLILIIVLNQVMDSFVTPRMVGKGVQAPSVIVFVSFMFWSWILGPLGAFLALPFTLAIRGILARVPSTRFAADFLTEVTISKPRPLTPKKRNGQRK